MANDKELKDVTDVQKITEIRYEQLNEEFRRFPGIFAYWAQLEAEARGKVLVAKALMEQTNARLATEHRGRADFHKIKITEAQVEEKVTQEADYVKVKEAFNKATGDSLRISAVVSALEKKGDMLKQLGYVRSAELAHLDEGTLPAKK